MCVSARSCFVCVLSLQANVKSKKASGFYSAQSFFDGFTNNAMGVVGFVSEGIKEEVRRL